MTPTGSSPSPDGATFALSTAADAEYEVYLFELGPQDCNSVAVLQNVIGGPCLPAFMSFAGYAPESPMWVWVGPTIYDGPQIEFDYLLLGTGLMPGVIATENTSWSSMKALYQ